MNIELLNVRIFISKNEVVTDAIGNHKKLPKLSGFCRKMRDMDSKKIPIAAYLLRKAMNATIGKSTT